ncbi:MAG: MFS transporter [Erysipelotrichaceae bacterium]|jgi:GPH family glycoside/pentoside/hexuronide:cation symporter
MSSKGIIKLKEKLGFMTFSAGLNIVYTFKNLYYLIFLTNVLKIDVLMAGTMLTLGTVWDAINDPLIGIWSANHTFKNGEKVRPYNLLFCVPWAITIVLLFSDFKTTQTLTIILALAVYFVFETFHTFMGMPYNSMGALASPHDSDRRSINAFRSLGGVLGSGIGSVAVTPLVKLFGGLQGKGAIIGAQDARALFLTACTMGLICIGGSLTHYFTTKERVRQISDDDEKISLAKGYKMLFGCKSWVLNMLYIICYGVNNTIIMNSINYYAAYVLGESSAAMPILAVYLVFTIFFSIVTPMIDEKLGRKKTMFLAAFVLLIGKIPFILSPYTPITVYINAMTLGFGGPVTFIMFNTNRNNISDIIEWKNGRRIDSLVSSGDNLASKMAEAGAIQLIAFSLKLAGFNEALKINQTPETIMTINSFLGWIPAIIAILMMIVLTKMDVEKEMKESKANSVV